MAFAYTKVPVCYVYLPFQDYYTVHGQDAIFAAKEIFRSMGVVKYWGKIAIVNYVMISVLSFTPS